MIRTLRALLDWLDKRFPAKVILSESELKNLNSRAFTMEDQQRRIWEILSDLRGQIIALENSVAAIKDAMVKGQTPLIAADNRRAEFIKAGRFSDG